MKKCLLAFCMSFSILTVSAQDPTLSVGLETLTMNKGQIDVAALTELIMEKQKELKHEALKRFMFNFFPQSNYTTKYYVQNCLNILLNETHPQVIEKEILELTTNYALSMGVASVVYKNKILNNDLKNVSAKYRNEMKVYQRIGAKKSTAEKRRERLLNEVETLRIQVNKSPNEDEKKRLKEKNDELRLFEIRKGLLQVSTNTNETDSIDFGLILDLTSAALSNIIDLKSKGFFKKSIDYKQDDFYSRLADNTFKDSLKTIEVAIQSTIEPYIKSYDVIKEFYGRFKDSEVLPGTNITGILSAEYVRAVTSEYNTSAILDLLSNKGKLIALAKTTKDNIDTIKSIEQKLTQLYSVEQGLKALQTNSIKKLNDEQTKLIQVQKTDTETFTKKIAEGDSTFKASQGLSEIKTSDLVDRARLLSNQRIDVSSKELETIFSIMEAEMKNVDLSNDFRKLLSTLYSDFKRLTDIAKMIDDLRREIDEEKASFEKNKSRLNIYRNIFKHNQFLDKLNAENIFEYDKDISSALDSISVGTEKLENQRSVITKELVTKDDFLVAYFSDLLNNFILPEKFNIGVDESKEFEFKSRALYADSLAKAYTILKDISKKETITLQEINYLDDQIIPFFINHSILYLSRSPDTNLTMRIKEFQLLSNLLKIKAISKISLSRYDTSYMKVFGFIANLGNLDKAKTYQQMLDLFQYSNEYVASSLPNGKFKSSYDLLANSVRKYTLINTRDQYVNIDVASFLGEMQRYYERRNSSKFSLYLTLGLNQAFLIDPIQHSLGDSLNVEKTKHLGFASEKLGVRFRIKRFHTAKGYENVTRGDIYLNSNSPFINDWFVALYGSGLLYSIANTTTDSNFDYPQIGLTTGLRFYNALDLNFFYAVPFVDGKRAFSNGMFGIAFDIPLGEYLEKVGKRR